MGETSATRTLRGHLASAGAHVQRFEDKLSPGIPDMGVGRHGVYLFAEGKFVKELPARDTTKIRFGAPNEPRLIHQRNWLNAHRDKGGLCCFWVRVRDGGWYLFFDEFELLVDGIEKQVLLEQKRNFGSALKLASAMNEAMLDHASRV